MTNLEPGDIVMCTVERIAGTVVFVSIDNNGTGSIILSEIAPGRIRNLRDYVVPKKRIICKVLRVSKDNVDLSLRRVTPKEQKEIREKYKLEKSYTSLINTNLSEKNKEIIEKILSNYETLYDFFEEAKKDSQESEKILGKTESKKILDIIHNQKKRTTEIKKEFNLSSTKENGITLIKEILGKIKNSEVKYISAGRYLIKTKGEDPKKADAETKETLEKIEKEAKEKGLEFSIKEK